MTNSAQELRCKVSLVSISRTKQLIAPKLISGEQFVFEWMKNLVTKAK